MEKEVIVISGRKLLGLLVLSLLVTIGINQYCSDESSADPVVTYTGGGESYMHSMKLMGHILHLHPGMELLRK